METNGDGSALMVNKELESDWVSHNPLDLMSRIKISGPNLAVKPELYQKAERFHLILYVDIETLFPWLFPVSNAFTHRANMNQTKWLHFSQTDILWLRYSHQFHSWNDHLKTNDAGRPAVIRYITCARYIFQGGNLWVPHSRIWS